MRDSSSFNALYAGPVALAAPGPVKAAPSAKEQIASGNSLPLLLALAALSVAFWTIAASFHIELLIFLLAFILLILTTILLATGRTVAGLALMAYLVAVEPAIRSYGVALPFLVLEYAIPIWAILAVWLNRGRLKLNSQFICYAAYFLYELVGLIGADNADFSRSVLLPSATLLAFLLLSSQVRLDRQAIRLILIGYVFGGITIASLAARIYFTGQLIQWSTASNFTTSGGMGPDQVSLLLGINVFCCLRLLEDSRRIIKGFYAVTAFALMLVMILTFARGGLYLLAGALVIYYILLRKPNLKSIFGVGALVLLTLVIFNIAAGTTQGAILDRFGNFDTSNRNELAGLGLRIFQQEPLFGVGTGNYHTVVSDANYFGITSGAHNEFTRALAEHGISGLIPWLLFVIFSVVKSLRSSSAETRSLRSALLFLGLGSMIYNGLKLASQSFFVFFALAACPDPAAEAQPEQDALPYGRRAPEIVHLPNNL